MFVVSVMPIGRGAFKDRLSFFSKKTLEPGVVVDIRIRTAVTPALVIECRNAQEEKAALRAETYALKKLEPEHTRRIFSEKTIHALQNVARHYATGEGIVFAHFTPSAVMGSRTTIEEASPDTESLDIAADRLALQAEYDERISVYRNTTREAFAKGESVMVLAPTVAEAERLHEELSRGIETQTILLTSGLSKKASITAWNRAVAHQEPVLLIMTHSFLSVPRKGVTTMFIERESARSYTAPYAPYLDARIASEAIARERGIRIVYGDFPLRPEIHAMLKNHEIEEHGRLQRTAQSRGAGRSPKVRIMDVRLKDESTPKKKRFAPLTERIQELIRSETARGGRIFIYAARRGIAPLTVCNDCGTPVTDPSTGAPMTLHKVKGRNVFLSFRSGALLPAETACRSCGGWNLVSLGIGAERVVDEIKKIVPEVPLFVITAESAGTHVRAKKIAKEFFGTPGSILVGTDRALPYLFEPVDYTIVASIDSVLSSSAWRAHTYALHTLFYLAGRTSETVFVQTRLPEAPALRAFGSGNPTEFITQELQDRKSYQYPPYATFVGLSWTGSEHAVSKTAEALKKSLASYDVVGPLPPRTLSKNRFLGRAVIRLPKQAWPDAALASLLKTFSPGVAIAIDPDEIV